MALSEGERVRYARQLLLPELSGSAHERVLSARVVASDKADVGVRSAFALYATRAGLGVRAADEPLVTVTLPSPEELRTYARGSHREPAVALLAGALAASSALLEAAGIRTAASLSDQLSVVSEDV